MKLIFINGPTGVGKTTLSLRLNEAMPMSYVLDLDKIRIAIGQYKKYRSESRWLSFDIAFAIAEVCLREKRDFIIGKGIIQAKGDEFKDNIIDKFIEIGNKYHAHVYELFLSASKKNTLSRIKHRGYEFKPKHSKQTLDKYYALAQETL